MKPLVTFGPFEGDREEKSADVFVDGKRVGWINKSYDHTFENRASMRRVWKFNMVELVLTGLDEDFDWPAPRWDATTGAKAAREKARALLGGT